MEGVNDSLWEGFLCLRLAIYLPEFGGQYLGAGGRGL